MKDDLNVLEKLMQSLMSMVTVLLSSMISQESTMPQSTQKFNQEQNPKETFSWSLCQCGRPKKKMALSLLKNSAIIIVILVQVAIQTKNLKS